MSTVGPYSVFVGNSGWTYGFTSLKAARTFVAAHVGRRYDIHKGSKLVESGKVHPASPGTGGKVWLVQNPQGPDAAPPLTDHQKQVKASRRKFCDYCNSRSSPTGGGIIRGGPGKFGYSRVCARCILKGATGGAQKNPRAKTDVAFTVDKNNKPVAYNMHGRGGWQSQGRMIGGSPVRMNWDEAKLWVSTGQAREVRYRSDAADQRGASGYHHGMTVNPDPGQGGYTIYSDDGFITGDIKTLAQAKTTAKRLAIDQNTYVYDPAGKKRATFKMKYPKSSNPAGSAIGYIQPRNGKGRKIAVYQQASGKLVAGGERYADMNDLLGHIDSRWTYVARNPLPVDRWVKVKARRLANGKIELRGNR